LHYVSKLTESGHGGKSEGRTRVAGGLSHVQWLESFFRDVAAHQHRARTRSQAVRWPRAYPTTYAIPTRLPTLAKRQSNTLARPQRDVGTAAFLFALVPVTERLHQASIKRNRSHDRGMVVWSLWTGSLSHQRVSQPRSTAEPTTYCHSRTNTTAISCQDQLAEFEVSASPRNAAGG